MAAVTTRTGSRSLLGIIGASLAARAKRKGRTSKIAALVSDHGLTVAAFAVADVTVWHSVGTLAGGIAVFVSLLFIDLKLQG